jgi:hypothetical protein
MIEVEYPPVIDTDVVYDEGAEQSKFLVGALANVDAELLTSGYSQIRLAQAHASRALDLLRDCGDDVSAQYLMLMNSRLWLDQAKGARA